ncbi:hypothetical protein GOODEAATRI_012779 [Goodea atripinnis]|uniref:Uncharacterized protein n=1 Tax=Goodea atripinnis TaxID=208336 RepID=A0ABV0NJP7_9TELE
MHSPATPCLYQEIRERGLHSTNQDELLEDFVVVEPPAQDQGIVMKSYKQAHLTWSQLPQVKESGILSTITPQERKRQEPFPLVSASRWVKKRGELAISSEELSIWRAFANRSYYLFLFNDVLIVTKKKS